MSDRPSSLNMDYEPRIYRAGRSCEFWVLNPAKVFRDKKGNPVPEYNPIHVNCGTCLHYNPKDNGRCTSEEFHREYYA